jgi:hypothetical protein
MLITENDGTDRLATTLPPIVPYGRNTSEHLRRNASPAYLFARFWTRPAAE